MCKKSTKRFRFLITLLGIILIAACASNLWVADNPTEEAIEKAAEDYAEVTLRLPPNALDGTLDITPDTPEVDNS